MRTLTSNRSGSRGGVSKKIGAPWQAQGAFLFGPVVVSLQDGG